MAEQLIQNTPRNYIEDDLFNFSNFVESLYDLLNTIHPDRGFVVSLNGEWGSGKSTILNFLKEKCLRKGNESNFTIIDFSPWNIIDKQTLLKSYFITLQNCLYKEDKNLKIRRMLEEYYSLIIEGIKYISKKNFIIDLIQKLCSNFFNTKSIFDIKNDIINYLENNYKGKKIVICIDDLDRLTDEEICIVLKLIKEIADFPKIIYLISMDKNHVISAIDSHYKYKDTNKAYNYLEKFIQLERSIPIINNYDFEKIIYNEIRDFIGNEKFEYENYYFDLVYKKCLKNKINTPRKLILLINQYKTSYKRYEYYVNFVDYLVILFFQLFYPDFYIFIKENKKLLTSFDSRLSDDNKQKNKEYFDNKLKNITCGINYAKDVLSCLFPDFDLNCGVDNTYVDLDTFMRNLIRTEDWFDFYFGKIDYQQENTQQIKELVTADNENKILNYLNKYYKKDNNIISRKIEYLLFCWKYLDHNLEPLKNILLGILIFFNDKPEYKDWYKFLIKPILNSLDRKTFETLILHILIESNIVKIHETFIYLLTTGNNEITKKCISDNMCIQMSQLFISNIIESKKDLSYSSANAFVALLLKHNLYKELEKYLNIYKDHCVFLIFDIFQKYDTNIQITFNNIPILKSEDFWKRICNGNLLFMKNYDKTVLSFLKYEKYNNLESLFGDSLKLTLQQYVKITNLKRITYYTKKLKSGADRT